MNEIKELNKWSDSLCPWRGSLNIVKMSVFPNSVDRCSATTKIPSKLFYGYWQIDSSLYEEEKGPELRKNKVEILILYNFKTYNTSIEYDIGK